MRVFLLGVAMASWSAGAGWAEEFALAAEPAPKPTVKIWSDEIQADLDGAKDGLEQEQAKWLVERAKWAAEREAIRIELENFEKERVTKSKRQWDQEFDNLRRKAQQENEKHEKKVAQEMAKSTQEREKSSGEYKHKANKSSGDGDTRTYSSSRSGSIEIGGMSGRSRTSSSSGGSRGGESGGGSSSISASSTIIPMDR